MPVFPNALSPLSTPGLRYLASGRTLLPQPGALIARWSADDIPAQADNTSLASWTDSVGGIAAAQTTAAQQPKYRTAQIGTKPGVQFSGGQVLDAGRPAAMTAAMNAKTYTMIVIVSQIAAKANGVFFGNSSASGVLLQGTGTRAGFYPGNLFPYTAATPLVIGYVGYASTAALGSGSVGSLAYLNGGCTGGSTVAPTSGSTNFAIGGFAPLNFAGIGVVHEVLMWNRSLTPGEMLQTQKWYCDKYGQPYPWAASGRFDIFHGDSLTYGQSKDADEFSYPAYVASMNNRPLGSWTNLGFSERPGPSSIR